MLAGCLSIFSSIILISTAILEERTQINKETNDKTKSLSELESFFGEGKSSDLFWSDIREMMEKVIVTRRWNKAYTLEKGQILMKNLIEKALPVLPELFEDRMETVYQLYIDNGHEDWAYGLANHVESLSFHLDNPQLGIPGRT